MKSIYILYFARNHKCLGTNQNKTAQITHSHKNDIKLYICIITDLYIFHILHALWWILLEGPRFRNKIDYSKCGFTLFVAFIFCSYEKVLFI